jgi:hypothetical protein
VAWALAVIVVIGVGLPIAAWQFSRRTENAHQPQPSSGLGPPADAADRWLIDHHRLPAMQRWRVRDAVITGSTLRESELRAATRDLADAVLRGEIKVGRAMRVMARINMANGLLFAAATVLVWIKVNPAISVIPMLFAARFLATGVIAAARIHRGPRRAYERNGPE